jgi:hypothetical protein
MEKANKHDPIREPDHDDDEVYPCWDCGVLRSKNQGGTTFTVCDGCWDKRHSRADPDARMGGRDHIPEEATGELLEPTGD